MKRKKKRKGKEKRKKKIKNLLLKRKLNMLKRLKKRDRRSN